jgi:hypothetical protein
MQVRKKKQREAKILKKYIRLFTNSFVALGGFMVSFILIYISTRNFFYKT